MKKTLPLALLLLGHVTAWAQSSTQPVQFTCPEPPHPSRKVNKDLPLPVATLTPATANSVNPGPGPTTASCSGVINVNIHFMLRLDGTGNFNETDDGTPYKAWNANQPH